MGLLDWFKETYHGKQQPPAQTPYFHMPKDRPVGPARHNLQQDLVDAIRMSGRDQNPEMIEALVKYVESLAGIKTFAAVDPFMEGVFKKRKFDIQNVLEGFFLRPENERFLPKEDWASIASGELPLEIQEFVNSVLQNVQTLWMEREFKEVETEKAIGPDGKIREFEKGAVPAGYKPVETPPPPVAQPSVQPQPVVTPEVAPQAASPVEQPAEIPLQESVPVSPNKPKEVMIRPPKKKSFRAW